MIRHDYQLADRYQAETGTVFMSGIQALARIPIEQLRIDQLAGRDTAAFVSGYPGSPLGGFDQELSRALRLVPDLPVVHQPAVNEELGASAVMGSQLAATRPDVRYDGVVGIWYGKAPGLDRATDALRHGVFAGSSSTGGALALVGDDPAAKSSTMPSSSDSAIVDLHMPVLYPGTISECLELGLHGIAMSRATGLWSALKIVTPVADGTGTVTFPVLLEPPSIPTVTVDGTPDGRIWTPHPSAQFLGPGMVEVEKEFHEVRSDLARRYGIDNELNRITSNPRDAWIGIVSTGFTYTQVIEALRRLGFADIEDIGRAGIKLLQLRLPVPFDSDQLIQFAAGLDEIVVVEEKTPTLERLIRDCLYDSSIRPRVVGKQDPGGNKLLPSYGRLDSDVITPALRHRLEIQLGARMAPPPPEPRQLIPLTVQRTPFFCSGCPHNWGTKVPPEAVVGMGTGCHGMTLLMDEERVGESIGITAMGNEGAQWLGMAPFVDTKHVFQNFGDGTFLHSGQLAIQAAIGAKANITFKILYNDTVAMTGGQEASHRIGPAQIASVLLTHGAKQVAITTDDVSRYRHVKLPKGVKVHSRTDIVDVQKSLASIPGVTILIHDQECAAELRRERRRGRAPEPTTRVVINHRLCEGCGDCGDVSNCLSVQPVTTPLGRKTQIDQASCNVDLSCLQGDCPAFMTVQVDADSQTTSSLAGGIDPATVSIIDPTFTERPSTVVRMAGIGGTGVVTSAQILGTAALLIGLDVDGMDQTGLSQKAGPVISDLTITQPGAPRRSNLVGERQADVIIAFDQLVAASDGSISAASDLTVVFASTSTTPTGRQVADPSVPSPGAEALAARFEARAGADHMFTLDSIRLAEVLTGSGATANTLLIGVAVQSGLVPIELDAIREAIRLNGVAVDSNLAAFEWGRRWFHAPDEVESVKAANDRSGLRVDVPPLPSRLGKQVKALKLPTATNALVSMLAADLVAYQDSDYSDRFITTVGVAAQAASEEFTESVARGLHKLMAYKDEYEVARLMLSEDGLSPARNVSGSVVESGLRWQLHPPALRALGVSRKVEFGPRSASMFKALAAGKRFRNTRLDPFGRSEVRRVERRLIGEYEQAIRQVCGRLARSADRDLLAAIEIGNLPDSVRGYEQLKLDRAAQFREDLAEMLERFLAD